MRVFYKLPFVAREFFISVFAFLNSKWPRLRCGLAMGAEYRAFSHLYVCAWLWGWLSEGVFIDERRLTCTYPSFAAVATQ